MCNFGESRLYDDEVVYQFVEKSSKNVDALVDVAMSRILSTNIHTMNLNILQIHLWFQLIQKNSKIWGKKEMHLLLMILPSKYALHLLKPLFDLRINELIVN